MSQGEWASRITKREIYYGKMKNNSEKTLAN